MNASDNYVPRPAPSFGIGATILIFGGAGVILYLVTYLLIPWLSDTWGFEPVLFWFVAGGLFVFFPLLLAGVTIVRKETGSDSTAVIFEGLRFRKMTYEHWRWTGGAFLAIVVLSSAIALVLIIIKGNLNLHPPFMEFEPLRGGRYWILILWAPFWVLNIMGEEIMWRGVVLPRQEVRFGRYAGLVHAGGWTIFHLAFGWVMLFILAPILLILPYAAQRTGNTWVAVLIHACVNGPAFLVVALGWI
jgi:membrane protease YdiL (CAAX protease family)